MKPWVPENGVEFHWGDVFVCEPDWTWSVRDLPDLDLWYLTEGSGWIGDGRRRTPIGAGDCLLLKTGGSYESGHDPQRPLTLIAIHFDLIDRNGKPLRPAPGELPPLLRRMGAGGFFRELLMRALRCHQDGRRAEAGAWLQAALMEVVREDARSLPPGRMGLQAQGIQEICERIRRHPGRPVRVESLAAELHVSPEHFCRVFRQLQGMSPRAFIARTRMEGAQVLLWTSSHSVARIAELLAPQREDCVDLVGFPVFVLANLSLGIASVLPNWSLRRQEHAEAAPIVSHMREHGVNRILVPPSICAKLAHGPGLPLDAIFTGGGPVFPDMLERLSSGFPQAEIVSVYGSTEAEPIAHQKLGHVPQGIVDLTEAIKLDPRDPTAYYNRALLQLDQHKDHLALADLNTSIELEWRNPHALALRAALHCGAGRLVGPQVATPSASVRQYQQIGAPCPPTGEPTSGASGQPSGLSSHASRRP